MNEAIIPIWIIAIATSIRALVVMYELAWGLLHAGDDKEQRQQDEEIRQRDIDERAEMMRDAQRMLKDYTLHQRQAIEHMTGRKIADLTDAEIVSIVRSEGSEVEPEDSST